MCCIYAYVLLLENTIKKLRLKYFYSSLKAYLIILTLLIINIILIIITQLLKTLIFSVLMLKDIKYNMQFSELKKNALVK